MEADGKGTIFQPEHPTAIGQLQRMGLAEVTGKAKVVGTEGGGCLRRGIEDHQLTAAGNDKLTVGNRQRHNDIGRQSSMGIEMFEADNGVIETADRGTVDATRFSAYIEVATTIFHHIHHRIAA